MTKHISRPHCGRDAEDGNLKGIWALILALAALLVFAPVARADVEGGTHPYRDVGSPEVTPSNDDGEDDSDDDGDDDDEGDGDDGPSGDDGDDEDEGPDDDESSDDDEDEDDNGSDDDEGSTDDDDESGNPTDNPQQPTGPTTAGALGGVGSWLWPLLIALAGILAGTAVVLRQRRNRNG